MKLFLLIFAALFLCNSSVFAQTPQTLAADWEKQHFSTILPSNLRHADLKKQLEDLKKLDLKVAEVGKSYEQREIYQIEWGKGKTKVLMWSQMHGDEPTATDAVLDMLVYLQKNRNVKWVKDLENNLTLHIVSMLNPDGAEVFQRRNLQGIDINRDAVDLQTPEGQLLKKLRDEFAPDIAFNLHNQQSLTTAGNTNKQAAISLLVVTGDPEGKFNAGSERNRRICALIINALNNFIPGHIARYDDEYNPRAFGDRISEWGSPVILIETGELHGKDEWFLVKMNFVAYLVALRSLTDKSEQTADGKIYDNLPRNDSGNIYHFIFRRANIINFTENPEPYIADVSMNSERRRASQTAPAFIRDIGDLSIYTGLEEFDAQDFYLVNKMGLIKTGTGGELWFYKKSRKIDWTVKDFDKTEQPDAIFANSKWTKGAGVVPKKN